MTGLDRWLCDGVDSRWPVLPPVTLAVVEIGRRSGRRSRRRKLCCPGRADEQRVWMPSGSATLRRLGGVGLGTLGSAGVVGVVKAAGKGGGRGLGPTSERQSPPLRVVFRDPLRPTPVG